MAAVETMRLSGMAAGIRRVSNDAPLTPQRVAAEMPRPPSNVFRWRRSGAHIVPRLRGRSPQ